MELIQFLGVGEPKGSPHTPSVPRYAFCTGLLRLVHLVHLATLGERSTPRASEASLYKGQIIK